MTIIRLPDISVQDLSLHQKWALTLIAVMVPFLSSPQFPVLEGTNMEITDHDFRKAAARKEVEILRQAVWATLSAALRATTSDEAVRILARAVGVIIDVSESPFV